MSNFPQFRHIFVIEDLKVRRIISLEAQIYSIGRESANEIVIYDPVVSRQHARLLKIKKTPSGDHYCYRIVDGDQEGNRSTNGIIINGHSYETYDLKHGDVISFGGQAKVSYYILSNALDIALFNPNKFHEDETDHYIQSSLDNTYATISSAHHELEHLDQQELLRLASFPELSPNPIVEISFEGEITYINPAAHLKFETLRLEKLAHPVLQGLLEQSKQTEGGLLLRSIRVREEVFEQYIHYLSDSRSIRSYLFDVTERERTERQLQYQAFHDLLTGLPNRVLFDQQLSAAIKQAKRGQYPMAVLFLDVDGFKNVNDSLGHSFGDRVLQGFAQRIAGCIREGDTLARWGGDEFTILLPRVHSGDDALTLAQRILEALKHRFDIQGQQLYITTSLGIALYPNDGEEGETLLKNADAALYRAKDCGRDRYQFYRETMTSKATLLLRLETLLHQALAEDKFSLHYQPQFHLKTGQITGMETLLHWYHPDIGCLSPDKLMPFVEQTELSIPLSHWVLKTACLQNIAWQKAGLPPLPISVNFSPRQLHNPHLVEMVAEVLEMTGLEPSLLEIEIAETSIMYDEVFAHSVFASLRSLGVHLSLDDFGTGYSALNYLQRLPFNTLKIDRTVMPSVLMNSRDLAILSTMITLGKNLDLRVIAEGVETTQQLEVLQSLNCEEAQGFLLSPPLNTEDSTQFLKQYYSEEMHFSYAKNNVN